MKKAFRIGYYRYINDKSFAEHIEFIKKNLDNVDEIALFVEFSHHGYWPIEGQKKMSELLGSRIKEYKKIGVKSVGLNVLDTIGHLEEAWDVLPKPPMQTMVGRDGRVSKSCLCINTDEYRSYTFERYNLLAHSNPDFIWVDDDVRIENHGVAGPCYCEHCIEKFNKKTGRSETRESLTVNPSKELISLWERFWTDCISEVCALIKEAVHQHNGDIKLGLMTGDGAHREWLEALGADMGRPGGGFYSDVDPFYLLVKFANCERQLDLYPDYVADRQYEFENFPYQELAKSDTVTALEVLFALMNGCNGIAFNAIFFKDNPTLMRLIDNNKLQWEQIVKRSNNSVNMGTYCGDNLGLCHDLLRIGMPATCSKKANTSIVLDGMAVDKMDDESLVKALSSAAFVTGEGFALIEQRGFAHLCGVETLNIYNNGVSEQFTDDELNGEYAGERRDSYINFGGVLPSIATLKTKDGVRVISMLNDLLGRQLGPCFTVYENELGGRVAVCTYVYSQFFWYISKRYQILNVFDWISRGLPVNIKTAIRVAPVLRRKENDGFILLLANMAFDEIKDVEVHIKMKAKSCKRIEADGSLTDIAVQTTDSGIRVNIDRIAPWSAVVLTDE